MMPPLYAATLSCAFLTPILMHPRELLHAPIEHDEIMDELQKPLLPA